MTDPQEMLRRMPFPFAGTGSPAQLGAVVQRSVLSGGDHHARCATPRTVTGSSATVSTIRTSLVRRSLRISGMSSNETRRWPSSPGLLLATLQRAVPRPSPGSSSDTRGNLNRWPDRRSAPSSQAIVLRWVGNIPTCLGRSACGDLTAFGVSVAGPVTGSSTVKKSLRSSCKADLPVVDGG